MRLYILAFVLFACKEDGETKEGNITETFVDSDGDGAPLEVDCDDNNSGINPNAEEICDGVDNNCNGQVDEGVQTSFYADSDGDSHGNPDIYVWACELIDGFVENNTDCDDIVATTHPGAVELCDGIDNDCDGVADNGIGETYYEDGDGDGYGSDAEIEACGPMDGIASQNGDCDDNNATIHPDGEEVCDEVDNDCDGEIDEDDAIDSRIWYGDFDADGYGGTESVYSCTQPNGYVDNMTDCNDADGNISPGGDEICDGLDNNCDGQIDEDLAVNATAWYLDADQDGYGASNSSIMACSQPSGYTDNGSDCDDHDNDIHPSAMELCDGEDNNCNGSIDEDSAVDAPLWFSDSDSDGYGDPNSSISSCNQPANSSANNSDCDDSNASISPAVNELCDDVDNDCDGTVDENSSIDATTWYYDADSDGHGGDVVSTVACDQPAGYVESSDDCDDLRLETNPSAVEICDDEDNNCDGTVDENATDATIWYLDDDGDGYGDPNTSLASCDQPADHVSDDGDCDDSSDLFAPDVVEECDGEDNNCDGETDEDCESETLDVVVSVLPKLGGFSQNQCFDGTQTGGNESFTFWSSARDLEVGMYCRLGVNGASLSQAQFEIEDSTGTVFHTSDVIACPVVNNTQYMSTIHTITLPSADSYTINTFGAGCNGFAADSFSVDAYLQFMN